MKLRSLAIFLILVLAVTGCANQKADTSKSIDQVKAEAEKMSVGSLENAAKAYASAIAAQKKEVEKIVTQMKGLPPQELFSEKGKGIRQEISKVQSQLSELTKRYNIYLQKLKEKGGDITKVAIK
ncbi:MAG: hypothetical protein A3G33_00515 [Omnitrophica bacterium RIFCSPLOWO2_12_FULL_44_17]|uniref:Lipoprotein n=1 Tax=Candidatus Danuiimicrobium aquiferis TaxID=1801832 RepID=A0A1G1L177_9BACT|nr:MAG: hypothetical protein A3B72_04880 [Omnitrophica bacterium RIFCSPHIGHO2_02_FULL_45_28]OGW91358.1 MAG: hypothetical protein A3E74_09210 [Omnitrophica bacterium RIFCSPHIGHO2_12_FULL_44_12]OGW98910.1 MAG: hypothetical protein A3G33_00515 [Omnitrophica bacterium RIFCSPLOWO2_12_FULL_44_17]OGX03220.1 MAG: hypothetical protein A3J12_09160 [Omnitrophica bacterium RIFCSPLOWO2_02_FULL_44_11]